MDAVGRLPVNTRAGTIASSVPSDDVYSWQRQYTDAAMWAPVTGYMNPVLDAKTQIESAENSVLSGSDSNQFFSRIDRAITGQAPRGSNVELSLDPNVQKAAWDAMGDLQGAVVAIEPSTGTSQSRSPNGSVMGRALM